MTPEVLEVGLNTLWVLLGAALVFFMQAGFAMVETGFTRAKNAGNIIMKNLMDFALGTIVFWAIGFGLMFGDDILGVIGLPTFFQGLNASPESYDFTTLIFQTVFCATAATIVSGAMAERTKFSSYCIYSVIISLFVYPVSGHWIWGGGWLAQLGFHDFAGSTAVHMVGGVAALIGAKILGPRIGKYTKSGESKAIPGHSLTLGALGVFILWFCWFGFNGCSTVSMTVSEDGASMSALASSVFVTTNLAAAVATATTMLFTWIKYKKPDVSMTLNGSLAGLVAITAGCDMVSPLGAAIIGLVAGILVVVGIEFVDKVLKIDDPVGAVGVHGICGAVGTLLVGLFALDGGLFYGGGIHFFLVQLLGVVSVIAWVTVTMVIVFLAIKHTIGLRVSKSEEIAGLDIEEHGLVSSYADFMPVVNNVMTTRETAQDKVEVKTEYVPTVKSTESSDTLKKVVILANQNRFEELKTAMNNIGITGMTVTKVLGCGVQKGSNNYYRGVKVDMNLLPKVKVEIVVCKVPVEEVVKTAERVLYSGNIGDGKIFIYDVDNVIKVRTGEEGCAALQDTDE